MTIRTLLKSFTLLLTLISTASHAQSLQVFGGGQSARNCYQAATIAAQTRYASTDDIKECTYALDNTSLRLRDRVATLVNRGVIYVALKEYNQAIKDYDRAYKISPDTAEIHVNRGNLLFMSQFFDQAVKEYTRAIELDFSRLHIAFYNRGLTYEKLGKPDQAAADYRRSLELVPDWSRAREKLQQLQGQSKNT